MLRGGEEAMSIGKSFKTEAPATGKVRLLMVESRKRETCSIVNWGNIRLMSVPQRCSHEIHRCGLKHLWISSTECSR
jgi:hypothetical protein